MLDQRPIHIVMTPVRNEAWVLNLFLEATSRWADHIVIADQMSTDGSREIAQSYPKVTLIDNGTAEFNESQRQAMLIAKAREIANGRDSILWGLDADEIFDAHFRETDDWRKIESSKPGDVFFFKWAEIRPDKKSIWVSKSTYFPWMFHDDGKEQHCNYVRDMHSMRIPYPKEEKQIYYVNDFKVLHFAYVNPNRVVAKRRFYIFVDWELHHRDPITLSRSYTNTKLEDSVSILPDNYCYSAAKHGFDMWALVDDSVSIPWMDDYISERIGRNDINGLRKLDIWDKDFTAMLRAKDPRTVKDKIIHWYLDKSKHYKNSLSIRFIDKILKKTY